MNDFPKYIYGNRGLNRSWVIALILFLILEVCALSIFVAIWAVNGNPAGMRVAIPVEKTSTIDLTQQQTTEVPIFTTEAIPTQIITTPSPTASEEAIPTFQLPHFDVPPPGKIVFTCFDGSFDQICIMNADGTGRRQLTDDNATSFYPSLSPDGEQIVYSSRRDGNFEIYLMSVNGGNPIQITDGIGNLYSPEISPKGNRIVFTAESGGLQSVWIMKINGDNARPFVESSGNDIDPSWAPDANQIVFASKRSGTTGLYIANADGTKPRGVTPKNLSTGGRSSWSPLGFWIAFYAGPRGNRDIYTIGTDGKGISKLTNGGDNLAPSYSPDGEWLAFTSYRDGNNEIYVMRNDGTQVHRLTFNPQSDWQPRWGP